MGQGVVKSTDPSVLAPVAGEAAAGDQWGDETGLIAAAKRGDCEAFGALMRRYQDRVYNQAWRLLGDHDEACDLVQEVFIRVFRKIHLYRGDAAFSTWLYRITVNLAKNRWKQMERQGRGRTFSLSQPEHEQDDNRPPEQADTTPDPRQLSAGRELLERIEEQMMRLSFEHRQVLVLRFVENLSYEQIAQVLNTSLGTVKSRICRARRELRTLMEPYLE